MQDPGAEFGGGEGWKEGRGVAACCKTPHFSTVITPQNNRSGFQIPQWTQPLEWNDGEQNLKNIWATLNVASKFFAILYASWQLSFFIWANVALFGAVWLRLFWNWVINSSYCTAVHWSAAMVILDFIWKYWQAMHCFIHYRCIDGLHSCFFQHSENLTGDGAGGCGQNFVWK